MPINNLHHEHVSEFTSQGALIKRQLDLGYNNVELDKPLTTDQYKLAAELLAGYRALKAEAVKFYDAMLKPLNEKRNTILGWKRGDVSIINDTIDGLSTSLTSYEAEQERLREEQAEQALKDAEKKAAAERDDVLDELEALCGDDTSLQKDVEALKTQPPVLNITFADEPVKKEDVAVSSRDTYSVNVVDMVLLAEAVGNHQVQHDVLKPNQGVLNKIASLQKKNFNLPGCEVQVKRSYRRKGGR
jgi:hypothetical protein|tara:strand:- start:3052 stop:3786 length:735 start_codon:yes stop_codon:yes gene_type:complete